MIMSASLKALGLKPSSRERRSSGKAFSCSAGGRCGSSHSMVNSARFWYHHRTDSQMPSSSASAMVGVQCTSV